MKSRKKSPSEQFASAVIGFIAGTHMYGKPRPSTFELMLESRKLSKLTREMEKKYGLAGKQG
jgi:hypothetical protein